MNPENVLEMGSPGATGHRPGLGRTVQVSRTKKIAPKSKAPEVAANMPAEWWRALGAIECEELRRRLDPEEMPQILGRLCILAERALNANSDSVRQPGLELLVRVAQELKRVPDDGAQRDKQLRGDVKERHRAGLEEVTRIREHPDLALVAETALEDAALLADQAEGLALVRKRLCPFVLSVDTLDDAVLRNAIETFRKPRQKKPGRPRRDADTSTAEERAEAINSLMGPIGQSEPEPRDLERVLMKRRAQRQERARVLTGR